MNELVDVIIEDQQIERAVNNYLNEAYDELAEVCGMIDEDSGEPMYLENDEGIKEFKTRREFFEFIIKVSQDALQMIDMDKPEPALNT
jgi:hypothetical protein